MSGSNWKVRVVRHVEDLDLAADRDFAQTRQETQAANPMAAAG